MSGFQSTLPQGERPLTLVRRSTGVYFNPRSHKGSDGGDRASEVCECISIHAPTRGATMRLISRSQRFMHFNPRSHKGSDIGKRLAVEPNDDFNPRSHKGSDLPRPALRWYIPNFNPRSHKGSDPQRRRGKSGVMLFQSTLPQGERRR